jgi:hypothetical protein
MAVAKRDSQRSGMNAMLDGNGSKVRCKVDGCRIRRLITEQDVVGKKGLNSWKSEDGEWGDVSRDEGRDHVGMHSGQTDK